MFYFLKSVFGNLFFFSLLTLFLFINTGISGTLVIDDPDWPPFFFGLDKNEVKGIGKEIVYNALKRNGYSFEFEHLPIKRANLYIKTGEIDIAVFSYKKRRESFLIYCKEPLFITNYRFAIKKGSRIKIRSTKDLKNLSFGYLDGLTFSSDLIEIIKRKEKENLLVKIYSLENLIKGLAGRYQLYDITADSASTMIWKAKSMNLNDKVTILDYKICAKKYFVAISRNSKRIKDREKLRDLIDTYIRKIKKSGEYRKIFLRYGISL